MDVAIRRVEASDHDDVVRLAPRLLIGVDPRGPDLVRAALEDWVGESVTSAGSDGQAGWLALSEVALTRELPAGPTH